MTIRQLQHSFSSLMYTSSGEYSSIVNLQRIAMLNVEAFIRQIAVAGSECYLMTCKNIPEFFQDLYYT